MNDNRKIAIVGRIIVKNKNEWKETHTHTNTRKNLKINLLNVIFLFFLF